MPLGFHDGDALQWLAKRGIDVGPDHMGRLSIPVADAQHLWDDAAKRASDDVAEQALIRGQVHTANLRRAAVAEETMSAAIRHTNVGKAHAAAWAAVAEYDKTLPKEVRKRLDALPSTLTYAL